MFQERIRNGLIERAGLSEEQVRDALRAAQVSSPSRGQRVDNRRVLAEID